MSGRDLNYSDHSLQSLNKLLPDTGSAVPPTYHTADTYDIGLYALERRKIVELETACKS
jgi:hypothetical protein